MVEKMESSFTRGERKADCCASFAYKILVAGGLKINAMLASYHSHSSYLVPDNLLPALIEAKKSELASYPDTQKYPLFKKKWIIDGHPYEEIEATQNPKNSLWKYAACIGLFGVGGALIISKDMCPDSISEYCEALKPYIPSLN